MKKKLIIALALLVLFSTYQPQELFFKNKLNIKEIKILRSYKLLIGAIK